MAKELTSQHAQALSKLGAAKGGKARAESLSPEERKDIARHAAEARWSAVDRISLPKEKHSGVLQIGKAELQCGVLDNGIRVFPTRGITRALGGRRTGTAGGATDGAPQLPPFLASESVKPFISPQLMARLISPVQYKPKHGGRTAYGYEATLLPEICEVIIDANDAKPFRPNQRYLVETANLLIRGFARVGIIALVDEATGYQEEREKTELVRILEAYIEEELRPYVRKFPHEFFKQVYKLHGWDYKAGDTRSPRYIGKFINKYIYEPLPPQVLPKLKELNPANNKGQRRHKHFQYLTEDVGEPNLDKQITAVTTIMKLSTDVKTFDENFKSVFAKHYQNKLPYQEREPLIIDVEGEM